MKTITKPVYYCEFCNKKGLNKGMMLKHETKCLNNPKNIRACLNCIYLKEVSVQYEVEYQIAVDDFRTQEKQTSGFKCTVFDKLYYHVKAELNGLPEKYPDTFENQFPMPTECVKMNSNEFFEDLFDI